MGLEKNRNDRLRVQNFKEEMSGVLIVRYKNGISSMTLCIWENG